MLNEKARTGAPSTTRSSAAGPALGVGAPLAPSRTITHEGYVKSVLALSHLATTAGPAQPVPESLLALLLTGVTEGDVRVWDLAADAETSSTRRTITGEAVVEGSGAGERRSLEGHWHEVTALQPWWRPLPGPLPDSESEASTDAPPRQASAAGGEWWVVSGGLDGSIRRWRLAGEFVADSTSCYLLITVHRRLSASPTEARRAGGEAKAQGGERHDGGGRARARRADER